MAEEPQSIIPVIQLSSEDAATQKVAPPATSLDLIKATEATQGLQHYPMTEALGKVYDAGEVRNQGVNILMTALSRLRETDLNDARIERTQAQNELNSVRQQYHEEQTRNAVLEERLRCEVPLRRLQNILITLGGLVVGCCFEPLVNKFSVVNCILTLVGLILMLIGWFYHGNVRKGSR